MAAAKDTLYFPSLNGLRAIAAFVVLFTHVERYKQIAGNPSILTVAFNSFAGGLSVSFFFVLSGFLITSLLLREKTTTGSIRIGKFLQRRVRRIWPLYYTVLLAGYLISIFLLKDTSANLLTNGLILNLLLLPNIAFAFDKIPEILIQVWSIGTEEQFYFLWPYLVKKFPVKALLKIFVGIILVWFAARLVINLSAGSDSLWNKLLFRTRIDCMAIGALAALYLLSARSGEKSMFVPNVAVTAGKKNRSGWAPLYSVTGGWMLAAVFAGLLWISWRYNMSIYQCYSVLFAVVILRVIRMPGSILETRPLRYLGKISYGIYLLHHFWVYFVFRAWPGGSGIFDKSPAGDLGAFAVVSLLTVASAMLSYELFESRFLRKRLSPQAV